MKISRPINLIASLLLGVIPSANALESENRLMEPQSANNPSPMKKISSFSQDELRKRGVQLRKDIDRTYATRKKRKVFKDDGSREESRF